MKNFKLNPQPINNQYWWKKFLFLLFVLPPFFGFSQDLFMFNSEKVDYTMTSDQAQEFSDIVIEDEYVNYKMVTIKPLSESLYNQSLFINIPDITCGNIEFQAKQVNYAFNNDYWWFGVLESTTANGCNSGMLSILKNGDGLFGTLSIDDKAYEIRDLSNDAYAVFEVDGDNEYEVCLYGALGITNKPTGKFSSEKSMCNDCSIDMLALVDDKARKKHYKNRIRSMVNVANATIILSQINVPTFKLDLIEIMNYDDMDLDKDDIQGDLAELMTAAGPLRAQKKADWVVLFTREKYKKDGNKFYGITAGTETSVPNPPDGFSIVELRKKVQRRMTFTHEFGHFLGAGHELSDNPTPGAAHAHRLCVPQTPIGNHTYSTVVHQRFSNLGQCAGSGRRIPYFSNPGVIVFGQPTGSLPRDDNASVIAANACAVAAYQLLPEMTFYISGDNYGCPNGSVHLATVINGDVCPFTWLWEVSYDGGTTYSNLVPSNMPNAVVSLPDLPGSNVTVRATAISATSSIAQYHTIQVQYEWPGQEIPCALAPGNTGNKISRKVNRTFSVSPNPTNDSWRMDLQKLNATNFTVNLYSSEGAKLFTSSTLDNNRGEFEIDATELNSGVYFIIIYDQEGIIVDSKKVIKY